MPARPLPGDRASAAMWLLPAAILIGVGAIGTSPLGPATEPLLYLAAVTPALIAADLAAHRLPNRLVLPAYPVLLVALGLQWWVTGGFPFLALVSGLGYFALMLALSAVGGMGMGDVKLAGALGLTAGMLGLDAALASPLLAFLAGGVAAVVALAAVRGRRGTRIPFGPFMLAGFWAAALLPL
ncbi:MAG: prepilin peptidase [Salinibacterium sp.]|nr:prepilin peptidase [Salinibacterium sp.]